MHPSLYRTIPPELQILRREILRGNRQRPPEEKVRHSYGGGGLTMARVEEEDEGVSRSELLSISMLMKARLRRNNAYGELGALQ